MKFAYFFFTAYFLFGFLFLNGQTFPYALTVLDEPYEDLTGANNATFGVWDDPEFEVPLGFDFIFYGDTVSTIYQIGFGAIMSFDQNAGYSAANYILAYTSDIIDRGYNDNTSLSSISYKTEGDFGSRICKIQWKNVGFYGELAYSYTSNDFINFQLWLYEGSNDIEVRIGPNSINMDTDVHNLNGMPAIGIMEGLNSYNYSYDAFWYLVGPPAGPKIGLSTEFSEVYSLNYLSDDPADSTVYRFSTGLTPSNDRIDLSGAVKIYPTITHSDILIEFDGEIIKDGEIKVVNNLGQLIISEAVKNNFQQINLSHLSTGQYFVNIQSGDGIYTEKIFVK